MSKKLSVGIVGLPNVGKSTLFNSITNAGVAAQNYPFCTIEPNVGIVSIPDYRLEKLSKLSSSDVILPAKIEFVDIAGLVEGASKGEGLGNQFLSHIRSTSVIAHVVRCFDSGDIAHVHGKVDPVADCNIINSELMMADFDFVEKIMATLHKKSKSNDKDSIKILNILDIVKNHLAEEKMINSLELTDDEWGLINAYDFITKKKQIYVANVSEDDLTQDNQYVTELKKYAEQTKQEVVICSASLEEECSTLSSEEKNEYLKELGVSYSGIDLLSIACFKLLGLQTYLTTGPKETRAWTIQRGMTAPQAAGVIHTDFEKGFIRANVISYSDFIDVGGFKEAKDSGVLRQEGKDYIMQDGDVVEFLFNV